MRRLLKSSHWCQFSKVAHVFCSSTSHGTFLLGALRGLLREIFLAWIPFIPAFATSAFLITELLPPWWCSFKFATFSLKSSRQKPLNKHAIKHKGHNVLTYSSNRSNRKRKNDVKTNLHIVSNAVLWAGQHHLWLTGYVNAMRHCFQWNHYDINKMKFYRTIYSHSQNILTMLWSKTGSTPNNSLDQSILAD